MRNRLVIFVFMVFTATSVLFAQEDTFDDVYLLQNFFRDAPISQTMVVDGGLIWDNYDFGNVLDIGAQGFYPINDRLQVGGRLSFRNVSLDQGDGESGISDLLVTGRYAFMPNISGGAYITLPIGSEDIGQSRFNFGAYGAIRKPVAPNMVVTGSLGLDFLEMDKINFRTGEVDSEYETSLFLGGGIIYAASNELSVIGELNLQTEGEFAILGGGVQYDLSSAGHVRGGLGLGLDDGAPDIRLMGSYLVRF